MHGRGRGAEGKGFSLGKAIAEFRKPTAIEAGSVGDFARLIAQSPNGPDPIRERIMTYQGLPVNPGGPFIHITARPTGVFGEGIEFVYKHEGGKPHEIVYREKNPHPMSGQTMVSLMERQNAERDRLRADVESAGEVLRQTANKPGLEGLLGLLGEMGESVRRGEARYGGLWDLTAFVPATPQGLAYRDKVSQYEQSFTEDRIECNLAAYATYQARQPELMQQLQAHFAGKQPNIEIDHGFGSDQVITKVIQERGTPTAWETPAPQRSRNIRRRGNHGIN